MSASKEKDWLFYSHPGKFLSTWRERWKFIAVVVALMLLSNWAGHAFFVEPFTAWYHDIQARRTSKLQERSTRIVRVDEREHRYIFGGRSPLFGDKIVQAVCALVSRGPSVVVVDLDTSAEYDFPQKLTLPQWPVPVIWATDVDDTQSANQLKPDPVLGGRVEPHPTYGLAVMPTDFDDVVRRWRQFEMVAGYPRPTLAWAAVRELCRDQGQDRPVRCPDRKELELEDALVMRVGEDPAFLNDFNFLPMGISEFMPADKSGQANPRGFPTVCPVSTKDPRLAGRIVILGGRFSRGDIHQTPWGRKQGAELVAMAIEHILDPASRPELAEYALLGFELVLAILIALIHHWIRPIPATIATLALLPLAVICAAELMFQLGGYQLGVVPFIVGMLIHQLVGSAERAEHLTHELEEGRASGTWK